MSYIINIKDIKGNNIMLKFCIRFNNADSYELFSMPENEKIRLSDECDFDTFCK